MRRPEIQDGMAGRLLSAVGHMRTSQLDGSEKPQLEWLFARASVTAWLDVRAGRMVVAALMLSDSRNVSYGAHWARAPSEVYGLYQATSYDGVQAHVRTDWAGKHFSLQTVTAESGGSPSNCFDTSFKSDHRGCRQRCSSE